MSIFGGTEILLPSQTSKILNRISGNKLEQDLVALAQIGGQRLPGGRWAVTRLALSQEDFLARRFLTGRMQEAGMNVNESPFGLVGTYPGRNKDAAPVDMVSHFDSVPEGGIYDGAVGVMGAIEVVRLLNETGVPLRRPLRVVAFTGEESSRFQVALGGSKAMIFGLTEDEANSSRPGDISIKEALKVAGCGDNDPTTRPYLETGQIPHVALELHISQNNRLAEKGLDLAVIETIAAPERFQIEIGTSVTSESPPSYARYLRMTINGMADHSGSTPMGLRNRADGLVAWSELLMVSGGFSGLSVGSVKPESQALNKIPGKTDIVMRFAGNSATIVDESMVRFQEYARVYSAGLSSDKFGKNPVAAEEIPEGEATNSFFYQKERHMLAARAILAVRDFAECFGSRNIVGTVGTFHINREGQILLGVDIRGVDSELRSHVVRMIQSQIIRERDGIGIQFKHLPGSSEPTNLDPSIVRLITEEIQRFNIGQSETAYSPAGHDIQTFALAKIPTGLIFIPSRNGGISHNPREYSTSGDLKKGTEALAAAAIRLAA